MHFNFSDFILLIYVCECLEVYEFIFFDLEFAGTWSSGEEDCSSSRFCLGMTHHQNRAL